MAGFEVTPEVLRELLTDLKRSPNYIQTAAGRYSDKLNGFGMWHTALINM